MSTRDLLGSLTLLVSELDTLTGQRPALAEVCSIGLSKYDRGLLNIAWGTSPIDVLAWCETTGAIHGRCLPSGDDDMVTITAEGRLGQQPVRVLAGLPRDLAHRLGHEWSTARLRELVSAPAPTEPATGGGR